MGFNEKLFGTKIRQNPTKRSAEFDRIVRHQKPLKVTWTNWLSSQQTLANDNYNNKLIATNVSTNCDNNNNNSNTDDNKNNSVNNSNKDIKCRERDKVKQ